MPRIIFIPSAIHVHQHNEHPFAGALGRPNVNPPAIVIQDNVQMLAFTVDTDSAFFTWEKPEEYDGGGINIMAHWTNDGDTDDNGLDVKIQVDYQTFNQQGDSIAGDHANSPKSIEDTYTSASGWIIHTTGAMTIPDADFSGKHIVAMKISFVTPAGAALSGEPHLIALMITYRYKI